MEPEDSIKIAVEGCGVKLYDIKQTKTNDENIYRVYIHSKDGITLDKCSEVSHIISPILDIHEPINSKYFLEVSSPGIVRKLKSLEHFKLSVGEYIKLKTKESVKYSGKLQKVEDDIITLENSQENITLAYSDILNASTSVKW
ncbi:MAG: hypothetical protein B1H07_03765 [Campylobacteraceae bacterium 4484_166]|nr:MAG: hypothetical protein B1H07_03765 [Campylobacteraceae bacterium 4484_166]